MKKIIITIFALLLLAGFAQAIQQITPPAAVTGYIYYPDSSIVAGATVQATCEHNGLNYISETQTSYDDGSYYIIFDPTECGYEDKISVTAEKDGQSGTSNAQTCTANECFIPVALVDVTIPEFGTIAGTVALIGALAIFIVKRK